MGILAKARTTMPVKKRKINVLFVISLYVLLLPALLKTFVFNYIPMYGLVVAFEDYSPYLGFFKSPWVGLEHIKYFLTDDKFWSVFKNTIILNIYSQVFCFTAPIIFALLVNEVMNTKFKRTVQTISYLPHFLSWIVVAGIFYQILSPTDGMVNNVLVNVLGIKPIFFMTEAKLFRGIIVFSSIWKGVGWSAILYFSIISGIDTQLYDAAMIDGAGRFKQAIHVTLPGMVPMIVLLLLLSVGNMFDYSFDQIFLMQNPLVYNVSDVISTYIYRLGLVQAQYSLTAAIGFVQNVLGFIFLISANSLSKKLAGIGLY